MSMMKNKNVTISLDEVKHIAKLASLELTNDEIKQYQSDLDEIMGFMNEIKGLDLKEVPETSRTSSEENVFRNDIVTKSFTQDEALSNAKNTHKGFFVVPHVLIGKEV